MIRLVLALAIGVLLFQSPAPPPAQAAAPTLSDIDRDIRAGVYGNVDRLLVLRNGAVVHDGSYARDYRALSRGRGNRQFAGTLWEHL